MAEPVVEDRTVLVTGGAGFISSHLVDALVADNAVRILDDFSTGVRDRVPKAVVVYEGDVRDQALVAEASDGMDLIYHLAAMVDVDASIEDPRACDSLNVGGTLTMLEAAREEDARLVLASSAAVYGQPERVPIREADHKRPTNPYGVSNLAADQYCRLYHELNGVETVALRYFNVYGPGQSGGPTAGSSRYFSSRRGMGSR